MADQKYSYQDWQLGKIQEDLETGALDLNIPSQFKQNIPAFLFNKDLISNEEYDTIKKAQYFTFVRGSEITIKALYKRFIKSLEKSDFPNDLLDIEIKDLEKKLNKYSANRIKDVLSGSWQKNGLTYKKLIQVYKHRDSTAIIHISNPSPLPAPNDDENYSDLFSEMMTNLNDKLNGNLESEFPFQKFRNYVDDLVTNDEYDIKVLYGYLKKLRSYREKAEQATNTSGNNYGTHQGNRDWIVNTFKLLKNDNYPDDDQLNKDSIKQEIESVKGRGLSDNRVAKQVVILYSYKFNGKSISKDQVKGFAVYNNR